MKLTKYEHACFSVELENQLVIVDPGSFADVPEDILQTVAIVITHSHADHFSQQNIRRIIDINPDAKIFTTSEVAEQLGDFKNVIEVLADDVEQVGPFTLAFSGEEHAVIHPSIDTIQNVGVVINNALYYSGDAFTAPKNSLPIELLLAPASAPWLKISEVIDFIANIQPSMVIPTHDALLSDKGKQITDNLLRSATEAEGASYQRLATGESILL